MVTLGDWNCWTAGLLACSFTAPHLQSGHSSDRMGARKVSSSPPDCASATRASSTPMPPSACSSWRCSPSCARSSWKRTCRAVEQARRVAGSEDWRLDIHAASGTEQQSSCRHEPPKPRAKKSCRSRMRLNRPPAPQCAAAPAGSAAPGPAHPPPRRRAASPAASPPAAARRPAWAAERKGNLDMVMR